MAHKDIRIPFVITDSNKEKHSFEIVGFLEDDEDRVTLQEALHRAGDGVVRSDEDWTLILDHLDQLPSLMFMEEGWLLAGRTMYGDASYLACLFRPNIRTRWSVHWREPTSRYSHQDVVIRRT